MPQRFDFTPVSVAKVTPEGFILDSPIVGRIGIQEYRNADGSVRRELRLPEEVFKADALSSMKGKPITVDHPAGGVTAANARAVTVGTVLSDGFKADSDKNVRADIVIHAPAEMGERRELSLGYAVEVEDSSGEHPVFGRYDAIQRNIAVNHLSIVARGRAGVARLNIDGDEETEIISQPERTMPKIKLDNGIEYDAAPEVIVEIERLRSTAKTNADAVTAATAARDSATAERDVLKAKVDAMPAAIEAARKEAEAAGRKDAADRAELVKVAEGFGVKVDAAMTGRAVKEAVILKTNAKFDAAGKSDAYIDAAFDMAKDLKGDAAMAAQRQAAAGGASGSGAGSRGDGGEAPSAKSAYDAHMERLQSGPAPDKKD